MFYQECELPVIRLLYSLRPNSVSMIDIHLLCSHMGFSLARIRFKTFLKIH